MSRRPFRSRCVPLIAIVMLALAAYACAGTQALPSPQPTQAPGATPMSPGVEAATAVPAITESRRLTLEWPNAIRAGDSDTVRLTLEVDTLGNIIPTAEVGGHEVGGGNVTIPNLYDTHNVMAESWLDIAGLNISPAEHISQPLLPGQSVTFYWSVQPEAVGDYRGTVWLKLHFIPKAGGDPSELVVSAQRLEIRAVNLFGVGGVTARVIGGGGALLGSVLSLDSIIEFGMKLLKRRRQESK